MTSDTSICIYNGTSYRYCGYVNTSTSAGSFAIQYANDSDTIHEYCFTVNPTNMSAESEDYWNNVLSDCFDNSIHWKATSLSDSIIISSTSANSTQTFALDVNMQNLKQQVENLIGVSAYTGKIVATAYKGSIILHVYEDLTYTVTSADTITLSEAMTVAGLMTGVLSLIVAPQYKLTETLLSLLGVGFGIGSLIPSGTTIKTYYAYATWDRYVKRRDSSVWLTEAVQHTISYLGIVNPDSDPVFCEIDEGSMAESYSPSQTKYEDTTALLEKGYAYYLTL